MVNFQATGKAVKGDSTKGKAFEGSGEAWRGEGNLREGRSGAHLFCRETHKTLSGVFPGKEEARHHEAPGFFYLLSAKPRAA